MVLNETTRVPRSRFGVTRFLIGVPMLAALVGVAWIQYSHWGFKQACEQSILDKQRELTKRKLDEKLAASKRKRAERATKRAIADAIAREERIKWTHIIEAATRAIQGDGAQAYGEESRSKSVAQLAAYRPSPQVSAEDADVWSFQRLKHIEPPQAADVSWGRNSIDQFILARLEAAGLAPNPSASRQVLGRRLWFDLIGLPPQSEEISAFVADDTPEAYEQRVAKLLQDPGFGERWGRMWLDLARYADSNGYEEDELRPHAYAYRDFVIWAMNVDLPFDLFTAWQIAGDELAADNPLAVAATGFFTAAPLNTFIPQESERFDELDDMVSTMGNAMLGLTIGCARCHDHMYDPIPTSDYYGLVAIFAETSRRQSYLVPDGGKEYRRWFDPVAKRRDEIKILLKARIKENNIRDLDYFTEEQKNLLRQPIDPNNLEQERLISLCERCLLITDEHLSGNTKPLRKDRKRHRQLVKELRKLEALLPPQPPMGLTLTGGKASKTHVLEGGDLKRKGGEVGPGFLSAVTAGRPAWDDGVWKAWAEPHSGGEARKPRSALAHWMTDVEKGAGALVARVIVNRLWQQHFGQGLVRTPSDFGKQGELPSHPELLEWLAMELVDHNWSLKHIHRLIVTSATYRQSSASSEKKRQADPENRLVARRTPRRITAEMMRDAMLLAAGTLQRDMYGPGVQPPIPRDAVYNTQQEPEETWPCDYESDRPALWRRSIYVMLKRTVPVPMLRLFDAPDGSFSCHERKETTVPTQALALWNAPFVMKHSERLAQRIIATGSSDDDQAQQLFRITLSRAPTKPEVAAVLDYFKQNGGLQRNGAENQPAKRKQALAELSHVLFMSNEFFYLD